jgi:eukaryotic-like serine/threonine-protein kinase
MFSAESERLLAGRYRLRVIIGRGGMGVVWQARDELLGRDVAVKEIVWPPHLDAAEWDLARQRAQREAQMAARLSHPNVVGIYDVVAEDDRPWIIMELVPYRSLRDQVQEDGPLTPAQAAQVGLGILGALRAAHKAGVLHRDVKPANVLIAPEGRVVLTDFGIARATDSPVLTGTGVLVGSPSYISPERALGSRAAAPADLWGLGACLYAAVEGRPPFDREGALASLTAVVIDEPDPPVRAGPLWPVISGLLRKDPGQRLSLDEVEGMLQQLAEGDGPEAVAMTPGTDAPSKTAEQFEVAGPVEAGESPVEAGESEAAGEIGVPRELEAGKAAGTANSSDVADTPEVAEAGRASVGEPAAEVSAGEAGTASAGDAEGASAGSITGPLPGAEETGDHGRADSGRPEVALPAAAAAARDGAGRRDRGRHRTRILLAAVAAVVVVVAVVVGLVLSSYGSPGTHRAAPPATSPSASASARPSVTPSASPSVTASASGGSGTLPAGFTRYTDSTGFSLAVPQGWQVSHAGHYVYIRDPSDSGIFLLIDQSDQPQPNALADWKEQATVRQASYPGYHLLRLQSVSYPHSEQAADWEFTYDRDGVPVHILNRNVLANATHAYALYWSTPVSDWTADYQYFQAFAATFRPAGVNQG